MRHHTFPLAPAPLPVIKPPTVIEVARILGLLKEARHTLDLVLDPDRVPEYSIYEGGLAGAVMDDLDETIFTAKALLRAVKESHVDD